MKGKGQGARPALWISLLYGMESAYSFILSISVRVAPAVFNNAFKVKYSSFNLAHVTISIITVNFKSVKIYSAAQEKSPTK